MSSIPPFRFDPSGFPDYSMPNKAFYEVVPYNTQGLSYEVAQDCFRIDRLPQTDALYAIEGDLKEVGGLNQLHEVSLKKLLPFVSSVGILCSRYGQKGSCTLISDDLALVACHTIENLDVRNLRATFNFMQGRSQASTYNVLEIVEYDASLDYAIIKLQGTPGRHHGHLSILPNEVPDGALALLHHPLSKPLKLSIHAFVQATCENSLLATYHDSDDGSSGGAYVGPSGAMLALHLGSTRTNDINIERLALPIHEIFSKHPNSILARLNRQAMPLPFLADLEKARNTLYKLPTYVRELDFIDREAFDHSKLINGDYLLRQATSDYPGVYIDSHQKNMHQIGLETITELEERPSTTCL